MNEEVALVERADIAPPAVARRGGDSSCGSPVTNGE